MTDTEIYDVLRSKMTDANVRLMSYKRKASCSDQQGARLGTAIGEILIEQNGDVEALRECLQQMVTEIAAIAVEVKGLRQAGLQ